MVKTGERVLVTTFGEKTLDADLDGNGQMTVDFGGLEREECEEKVREKIQTSKRFPDNYEFDYDHEIEPFTMRIVKYKILGKRQFTKDGSVFVPFPMKKPLHFLWYDNDTGRWRILEHTGT